MNNKILQKNINEFIKEERNITKKFKNLIIKCIEDNYIPVHKLKQNKNYHIWDLYPTCNLTFTGINEILKIEKEWKSCYVKNDYIDYHIYCKNGIVVRSAFTEVSLKEDLINVFKKDTIAQKIIYYLYSGNSVEVYEHKTWRECIK